MENKSIEKKYHRVKAIRFLIVFMYYSIYKMRSKNNKKPPEFLLNWLNDWRAYCHWRDKPFLASFGRVKVRDPYSNYCYPYKNIKNVMLAIRQPKN